jgi:hypothetical protein
VEESENMMNRTMLEDRLEESSNFRLHEEDWKTDPEPHQRDEDIKDEAFLFISTLSGMHLYILFVSLS